MNQIRPQEMNVGMVVMEDCYGTLYEVVELSESIPGGVIIRDLEERGEIAIDSGTWFLVEEAYTMAEHKRAIIEYCRTHKEDICNEFVPVLDDEQYAQTLEEDNWELEGKDDERWMFDCVPFDAQLRGYTQMTRIVTVQGE